MRNEQIFIDSSHREVFESLGCVAIFHSLRGAPTMHGALIILSAVGLYISLYFSLVYYRLIGANTGLVPSFCRMEEGACRLVIHHHDANLFGVPNSVLGVGYYLCVVMVGIGVGDPFFVSVMQFASWLSVLLAVYLVYSLFSRVRVVCPLCLVSHGINLVIAVLLTLCR